MDQGENFLPASIAAAWGERQRPAKGPKPVLSLARIVDAAIGLAAADGIGAVSMSRVAAAVGVTAMALYRYVANKDELLVLMVDAAIGAPPPEVDPDEGWRGGLARWAWAEHDRYLAHPWVLRIPISGPPITPNQIGWLEHGLRSLADTRLAEAEKLSTILLISNFVRIDATLRVEVYESYAQAGSPDRASGDDRMLAYARTLSRLTGDGRFPALTTMLASGVMDRADPPDDEFVFGLDRLLDGIEVLVTRRA